MRAWSPTRARCRAGRGSAPRDRRRRRAGRRSGPCRGRRRRTRCPREGVRAVPRPVVEDDVAVRAARAPEPREHRLEEARAAALEARALFERQDPARAEAKLREDVKLFEASAAALDFAHVARCRLAETVAAGPKTRRTCPEDREDRRRPKPCQGDCTSGAPESGASCTTRRKTSRTSGLRCVAKKMRAR